MIPKMIQKDQNSAHEYVIDDNKMKNIINKLDQEYYNKYNDLLTVTNICRYRNKFEIWD
jgi:hypothetical protein